MTPQRNPFSVLRIRTKGAFLFAFAALFLAGLSAAAAADFWEKKSFHEWTNQECTKMLTDSPWAWELKAINMSNLRDSDAAGGQQYISYIIQFRSALPIRQAMVRQAQIAGKYDSMSKEKKQAFDKKYESFLTANYGDKVAVNIAYSTNVRQLDVPMAQLWQSRTTAFFANSVFLYADKGQKAKLLEYRPGQGAQREFMFIFPRLVEGKPIATEQNKSLILEFIYATPGASSEGVNNGSGFAEFILKKMLFNGTLAY